MPKQQLTVKKVLMMGITIGIITMVVTLFMQHRQNKTLQASRESGLARVHDIGAVDRYATDSEGDHYYAIIRSNLPSAGNIEVWTRLVYSDEGKRIYLEKRRRNGLFVDGFDALKQRTARFELECHKKEYAVIEVFEVAKDGETLDYARTGSTKNWEKIPEDTFLDKLVAVACPRK